MYPISERPREPDTRVVFVESSTMRETLQPLLDAHGDRVHFRPSATGVSMVGLLHERPQRGKSGITNLERLNDRRRAMP